MDYHNGLMEEEEEETSSTDSSDQEEAPVPSEENTVNTFTPRSYQMELFEFAKEHNSILVLGTGSGKTFISILLIKELADSIRGSYSNGAKRTIFLVNTVPLVYQQKEAIANQTGYSVGHYEGSMNVDLWSEEKWIEELNKHEVLVMVAQIFKDLLLHRFISLDQVNLLILDECHHATGSHPMREIMREYNTFKDQEKELPRVMGLTACVLHGKCKENNIENYMRNLELVLDSVLVTSKDQGTVLNFTTKPQELIVQCKNVTYSDDYNELIGRLNNVKKALLEDIEGYSKTMQPKLKKFVSREIGGIIDVSKDLGEYILPEAISIQVQYLLEEAEADTLEEQTVIRSLGMKLKTVLLNYTVSHDDILKLLSGKVIRLIEFFRKATKHFNDDEVFALVFVKRRNTAKILCSLLMKLKNMFSELGYLKPECVVGGTFNVKNDLKVNEEILKQKKVIENFRKGLCNVIVSTSVLEEGIDIRKCNFVIRFNSAENFRAYVQSLGRARAVPSYFITLEYEDKYKDVCDERKCYWNLRKYLMSHCFNRKSPDSEQASYHFQGDEVEPPFAPFGITGAKITFNSAIQLINRYCGSLPQDKFTNLSVNVRKYKRDGKFFVELTPPMSSPFRKTVKSNPMNNYDDAKKSAALEMCKRLFGHNLLDKNLLPKKSKIDADEKAKMYLSVLEGEEEEIVKGLPQPGTKKRRQIYRKGLCRPFKEKKNFYLYRVYFQHLNTVKDELLLDSDALINQLGFICGGKLNCAAFPLYSKKWGEVNVIVEFVKVFRSKHELPFDDIKEFHRVVSNLLLLMNLDVMSYDHVTVGHSVYIVPLTKADDIDLIQLNKVNSMEVKSYKEHNAKDLSPLKKFDFEVEKYANGVVVPLYREREIFYIINILSNESPLTEFPESKKEYSSYKNYVEKKYNASVSNDNQPLLECKHFSKEFNYLEVSTPPIKTVISKHPKFIPELCLIIPLAASFCCQILCISSILHRVNGLQLEQEIYESVGYKCSEREKEYFVSRPLEYRWVEDLIEYYMRKGWKNLCLQLQIIDTMFILPGMILQALTPLHTRENFNLERLEILGDSYLKFSVGNHLYCKDVASHEGTLTIQRSNIVCNKTLYSLAKKKGLHEAFQGVQLAPFTASPPGFYVKEEIEEKLHEEKVDPKDWISYPKDVEFPRTAIIGEMNIRKAESSIASLYRKNCLDKVEEIIQYTFNDKSFLVSAFTHPSYTNNKVTDCYQRLEFLGDSILDYLITCHLFSKDQSYTPGQLTDLRSHYVKNETLARLAVRFGLHKYMYHMAPRIDTAIQRFIQMLNDGESDFNTEDDTLEAEDVEVPKALGDIVESLIGAVYQDSNQNMEITWDVVAILLKKEFEDTKEEIPINNVRALYEKVPSVKFESIKPTDDEPAKYIVKMPGYKELIGTGKNKRTAKQAAAKLALNHLKYSGASS